MKAWMLAAISSTSEKVTLPPFTANATWTAPPGVGFVNLSGKGADGTDFSVRTASQPVIHVNYRTDANTGTGSATWDSFKNLGPAAVTDLNADGVATWTYYQIDVWPDGKNNIVQQFPITVNDAIPGSVSLASDLGATGPITRSGSAQVVWDYYGPGGPGLPATGFGKTFAGGETGQPAPLTTFADVPVTPGQQYQMTVPSGASITISYYA